MAWLLALVFILTAVLIVGGIAGNWLFPAAITDLARQFDDQFLLTILITGFFLVLAHVILAYIALRFREGHGTAAYWLGNIKWVWGTVIVMAVVDLGLAFGSESIWHKLHLAENSSTAIRIEIVAQQFVWNVRYSGPDGQFGRGRRDLVDDALNPLGIDPADPAGKNDLVQPTLKARLASKRTG
jgi:heme/copper-type cytochrome/quinol oxidase subunit 2